MSPILYVQSLRKSYGAREVLRGVSFSLSKGERVALMGPSGSGKSTLLNCIGGIDRPDSGSVILEDADLTEIDATTLDRIRRSRLTHIFQFFHLLPTLSARENIAFPLQLMKTNPKEVEERVSDLLTRIQLEHRADAFPSELSGGEMQRVAIARALSPRPAIIYADEPTGNLDSKTGATILDLIEGLCDETETTLLLVTHSQEATRICRRTLHLLDGQFVN